MSQSPLSLAQLLETQIQTLALTLRPSTIEGYRSTRNRFLAYLSAAFPQVQQISDLRRDPHLLGWFGSQCDQQPPLQPKTRHNYLLCLRRLFDVLILQGHPLPADLIQPQDFPLLPQYLARPLSLSDDQLLQQELRRTDDLPANALLLTRATGMRVGECIDLTLDCLRQAGEHQWQLHVPLGKLRTERLVPADDDIQRIIARLVSLRASVPPQRPDGEKLLLPCRRSHDAFYQVLASALADAAQRAGCSTHVTPHRLRHSFASEMVRLGVSLPALMQMLGHKDIRMTLRYVEVTQLDLQREFHAARQNAAQPPHRMPVLPVPQGVISAGLPGIRQALSAARHLLGMYRRELANDKERRRLQRLDKRLLTVASQLKETNTAEK
jgi:site-specific recombinase XerD